MKLRHILALCALASLPATALGNAPAGESAMKRVSDVPRADAHFKRIKTLNYLASQNGQVFPAQTWEGITIVKTPSGTCIRTERSGVNFVADGDGFLPEYSEYRKVVSCSTSSMAAELFDSVKQAFKN